MATVDDIATTTNRRQGTGAARTVTLFAVGVGILLCAVANLRLTAVVAAIPVALWPIEYPRLIDESLPIDADTAARATWLASAVSDAWLLPARLGACWTWAMPAAPAPAEDTCIAVVNAALHASPSNGELWLFKAATLASQGEHGSEILDALRNSFLAAPAEGWIASSRVVLGLQLYRALPLDLQDHVDQDLRLVLQDPTFAQPLAEAYVTNVLLRESASPALNGLPADLMQQFVIEVQSVMRKRR